VFLTGKQRIFYIGMRSKQSLYIEISPGIIKWCLASTATGISAVKLGLQTVAENSLADACSAIYSGFAGNHPEQLIISLDRCYFMARFLRLPARNVQEAGAMLGFQLMKNLPCPLEDFIYDFLPLGIEAGSMNLAAFLIKKVKLSNLLDFFSRQNLMPQQVTLTSHGLSAWFAYQRAVSPGLKEPCALIDIGRRHGHLVLIDGGVILFSRSFSYCSDQRLEEDLRHCLAAARKQYSRCRIQQLVYTGIKKEKIISRLQPGDSVFIESTSGFRVDEPAPDSFDSQASWASLLGLTQIKPAEGLDFVSAPLKKQRLHSQRRKKRRQFAVLAGEILCIFLLLSGLYIFDRYSYLSFLDRKTKEAASEIDKLDRVASRLKAAGKYLTGETFFSDLLSRLVSASPEGVQFTYCDLNASRELSLKGYADKISDVFVVIQGLKNSGLFGEVKLRYACRLKQRKAKERVEFFIYAQKEVHS